MENITVRVKQVNNEFNFTLFDLYEIKLTLISGNKFWIDNSKNQTSIEEDKEVFEYFNNFKRTKDVFTISLPVILADKIVYLLNNPKR